VLEDTGIKLSVVAADIVGTSGRAMPSALVNGERDPAVLADLSIGHMRVKIPALKQALVGRFNDHHAFMVDLHLTDRPAHGRHQRTHRLQALGYDVTLAPRGAA